MSESTVPQTGFQDRNLVFGILAFQTQLLNEPSLIAGMQAWLHARSKSLGQVLLEQGSLTPEGLAHLDRLVQKHLGEETAHEDKRLTLFASDSTRTRERESTRQQADSVDTWTLPESESPQGPHAPSIDRASESLGGRYEIVRQHAQGGLGQVFLAHDLDLGRDVAIKEIRAAYVNEAESRNRFVLEAQITGGLEHPGVVPVYSLGRRPDGRPFYAMRFIQGETLKEAIARFHGGPATAYEPARRLELRQLLSRYVTVCNTVAYAHSRGIVHRDLKPSNILLGKYGETLIVDWGLAKVLDTRTGTPGEATEQTLRPLSASDLSTQAGQTLGTPAYMSPEQAAGRSAEVSTASDIYSLGATLYTILTGQPPIRGDSNLQILEKAREADWVPAHTINPQVPAGLEAICRKAMARRPSARYEAALDLAEDMEHWLADEPLRAWREPITLRLGRWVRRHRTSVTTAVAAVVVAALCLGGAAGLLLAAYRDAEKQGDLAGKQRDRAQARFQLARQAVDEFHTQVSESTELKAHGLEGLRKKLLEAAVRFYKQLVQEEADDAAVRAEHGRTYLRLGEISQTLGKQDEAAAAFKSAVAITQELVDAFGDQQPYLATLAKAQSRLSVLYYTMGRMDDAEQVLHQAQDIGQRLVDAYPQEWEYQKQLAGNLNNLALIYRTKGRNDLAEPVYGQSLVLRQQLVNAQPDQRELLQSLALNHNNLGLLYRDTGRTDLAEKAFQKSVPLCQRLVDRYPDEPAYQQDLAWSLYNLSELYQVMHKEELAQQNLERSLAMRKRLTESHPKVPSYEYDLAAAETSLGNLHFRMGRFDQAEKLLLQARVHLHHLVDDSQSKVPDYVNDLAGCNSSLGDLYRTIGRLDEAEKPMKEALSLWQQLTREYPDLLLYAVDLGFHYGGIGNLVREKGKQEEALTWYAEGVKRLKRALDQEPQHRDARAYLRTVYGGRAIALSELGRFREAEEDLCQAEGLGKDLDERDFHLWRAFVRARAGDHKTAVSEAEKAAADEHLSGRAYYDLAWATALAAAAVGRDTKLAAPEQNKRVSKCRAQAVAFLRKAHRAGAFQYSGLVELLRKNEDLRTLSSEPEFNKILAELRATPARDDKGTSKPK
jgi:serine/threonine-protein kinase